MPAKAITSASSVERGRWKFVSRASTRRKSKPGVTKRLVRPVSGRAAGEGLEDANGRGADCEDAAGGLDPGPRLGAHRVALAVERMILDALDRERPERVEADVQRHALDVEPGEELRREVEARRRGRRGAFGRRVHRLVALGIEKRLRDVRRQRRLSGRLADEPQPPTALAEMLAELDRSVALAGTQAARRPRQPLPLPALEPLEQEHLAARPLDRDPGRDDARVVHHRERARRAVRRADRRTTRWRTSPLEREYTSSRESSRRSSGRCAIAASGSSRSRAHLHSSDARRYRRD